MQQLITGSSKYYRIIGNEKKQVENMIWVRIDMASR